MVTAITVGVFVSLGLVLVARGIFAPQPSLADLANEKYRQTLRASGDGLSASLQNKMLQMVPPETFRTGDLATAMRVMNSTVEEHVFQKFAMGAAGAFVPFVGWFVMALVLDIDVPIILAFFAAMALAFLGFIFPDLAVKSQAEERRGDFISAFASYLNLASILVGASGGPESALERAAQSGSGWAFREIQAAIEYSRGDASVKHWDAFAELGREMDIRELREFAAAMSANATSSSLADTLTSRAENMRNKVMSGIEGDAEEATDKMNMPLSLLTMGLMIYILYAVLFSTIAGGAAIT